MSIFHKTFSFREIASSIYIYIYRDIYIYIYRALSLSLSLSLYIYIYIWQNNLAYKCQRSVAPVYPVSQKRVVIIFQITWCLLNTGSTESFSFICSYQMYINQCLTTMLCVYVCVCVCAIYQHKTWSKYKWAHCHHFPSKVFLSNTSIHMICIFRYAQDFLWLCFIWVKSCSKLIHGIIHPYHPGFLIYTGTITWSDYCHSASVVTPNHKCDFDWCKPRQII